jgi:hypothetical protein
MRRFVAVSAVLLLVGCGGYKKDLETICDARARAKVPATGKAEDQASAISEFLFLNVHTPKAKKIFSTLGSLSPAEKAKVLRREASKEGITSCALADEFDPPK